MKKLLGLLLLLSSSVWAGTPPPTGVSPITINSAMQISCPTCNTSGASGTVNLGTSGQVAYYAATGTAVSSQPQLSFSSNNVTIGTAGSNLLIPSFTTGILGVSGSIVDLFLTTGSGTTVVLSAGNPTITLANGTGLPLTTGITGILAGANGGTGIANTSKTITLGGNLTTSGAFGSTFTMTGTTNVTFPTSGTLSTTTGTLTAVSIATANGFSGSSSGGATPALTIIAGAIMPSSIAIGGSIGSDNFEVTGTSTFNGNIAIGANNITMTGSLGSTGARLTKGWFTDLQITNAIVGSITGNAATVTTNANLTGDVTSSGNATTLATVNSNVGSFTSANITVNGKGLITAAANGSSGGTVNSGTANQLAYYATSTNAVSTTSAIPNGITATTQSANDNSTKVATTAYVNAATVTSQNSVGGSRLFGTTYHNTTGKTMYVVFAYQTAGIATDTVEAISDSSSTPTTQLTQQNTSLNFFNTQSFMVLNGNYYKVTVTGTETVPTTWFEYE